ncbi:MAG: DUF1549 domain-containing protein [Gemmataceae bacterium]|nr:DUF1549 domain-containing protein [Gemmataceae bacterium]
MPRLPLAALLVIPSLATAAPPDFDREVAPVLASHCLSCHSGPKPKGDLDLSRKAGALAAVVAGQPDDSPLWQRVAADEMPPKKPLPAADRAVLKAWVEAGAGWGADPIDPFRFTTATRAGLDWWSLQPVKRPAIPDGANPVDHLVRAKLAEKGLTPSPPADKRTLLRRVTFDLIGLPPTPEEVAAFLKDESPDAYEKVVDRLLASPHYGERWARHWLDVARYGETDGFERNTPRPNSWPYRDWVVKALNADLPYDQFARLQLAGDVLKPGDPDAVAATGFLVAGVHNTVLGNDQMRAVARVDELEDLVGAVGQTFLGLTANCARCHDHKFDPLAQADFYRLASALSGVGHGERELPVPGLKAEVARVTAARAAVLKELAAVEAPARGGKAVPPAPLAAWDFRTGADDRVGTLHAKPAGGVKLTPAGAVFDGKTGYLRTGPLAADLRAKTLEAWVAVDPLTQRGGGVVTVQAADGNTFDAIVYAEQEARKWMAGSELFRRTKPFGGADEAAGGAVHVAVTYAGDGMVHAYRDGAAHGTAYKTTPPVVFKAGEATVQFGCRHGKPEPGRVLAGTVVAARVYGEALAPAEVAASFAAGPGGMPEAEIVAKLSAEANAERARLKERAATLSAELAKLRAKGEQRVYAVVPQPPGVTRVLGRGQVEQPGAVVAPGGLPAAGGVFHFGLPPDAPDAARRRKLAEWVTSPANPLFARVMVNRVWQHHLGHGLVPTPSDFGFNAGRPSHPELLDWLASEFADRKYSLKSMHKLIVTSAAYRQSSLPRKEAVAVDADNRLLWRVTPRRLEGEAVRDAMLAASGRLDRTVGGKGFSDYKEDNFNGTAYFEPFDPAGPEADRRSIYRFVPRGGNAGLLDTLDCPDPAAAAPRRAVTTTPLQALALWNGGFALRVSGAFAERLAKDRPGDVGGQVGRAWQLAFGRDPTPEERTAAEKLVAAHGLAALCRALFNANEFLVVG